MTFRFADFVEAANAARTPEGLFKLYATAIASFGYDRYLYCVITNSPPSAPRNFPSVVHNYPEHWMSVYVEKGFAAIDPLKEVAFRVRGPILWDDVPRIMPLTKEQEHCLYQGIESGLNKGIGIPFHGPFGELAGVGIASSERNTEVKPSTISNLGLISAQIHTAYVEMALGPLASPPIRLTAREREVLHWCALGKSNWTIGEILNVSEHAVKFHVANCIAKLGTDSRITAVLKAIRLGLIYP